jgi:hypothetical protein
MNAVQEFIDRVPADDENCAFKPLDTSDKDFSEGDLEDFDAAGRDRVDNASSRFGGEVLGNGRVTFSFLITPVRADHDKSQSGARGRPWEIDMTIGHRKNAQKRISPVPNRRRKEISSH